MGNTYFVTQSILFSTQKYNTHHSFSPSFACSTWVRRKDWVNISVKQRLLLLGVTKSKSPINGRVRGYMRLASLSVVYLNFGGQITQQFFRSHVAILELFLLCGRLPKKKTTTTTTTTTTTITTKPCADDSVQVPDFRLLVFPFHLTSPLYFANFLQTATPSSVESISYAWIPEFLRLLWESPTLCYHFHDAK